MAVDPRTFTFGNPAVSNLTADGECDVSFSWVLPAGLGGATVQLTVHTPLPQADPDTGRTAAQVFRDKLRAYVRAHEAGLRAAQTVPAAVTALNGVTAAIDLNAVGT